MSLCRVFKLSVTLVVTIMLTELHAKETTQDFISKYNKYNNVCRGMGYERRNCKGKDQGMLFLHTGTDTLHVFSLLRYLHVLV
jgi:hypothetical protein